MVVAFASPLPPKAQGRRPRTLAERQQLYADVKRYLWRYGTSTDVETDPIELLRELMDCIEHDESDFEKEHDELIKSESDLQAKVESLTAEVAALKAKFPSWWKG